MRVIVTADLHGFLPEIPECDLLLIAGDITPVTNHEIHYQRKWLREEFQDWLSWVPAKNIVGIAGNHDFVAQSQPHVMRELEWHYLHNESIEVDGFKIWGSPLSNRFGHWAFMGSEGMLAEVWDTIPSDIDILMTHGPAFEIGDGVKVGSYSMAKRDWHYSYDKHVGSTTLRNRLEYQEWPNLQLYVFGHIHEGYGRYEVRDIPALNASYVDDQYNPGNEPLEIELRPVETRPFDPLEMRAETTNG